MLAGLEYFPYEEDLVAERLHAKTLCHKFNLIAPSEIDQRLNLLKSLFRTSPNPYVEPPFYCDYGYNITTGKNFYANHGAIILDPAPVSIGDNVFLAPGVLISTATHPLDPKIRASGLEYAYAITIGNDVWIGMGAKILPGVSIGDNAVIGAGAVVTKNVPANTVVAGVPAVVIREL
ncbi:MAG: sugar O-acetyltransferase [Chitinophagaceae bacterium]|nr:MAG: sugar O-acetyltransferase [Chitinophagaceae bacterium]